MQKKVCMLGATATGKTSLVRQCVYGMFDKEYETTIGVNVERMDVPVGGQVVKLTMWDLEGYDDPLDEYRKDYIQGAHGYVLVVDGTRLETLDVARSLQQLAQDILVEAVPFVVVLNKRNLEGNRALSRGISNTLAQEGWTVYETSAKTGKNVPDAFQTLARKMLEIDESEARRTLRVERDNSTQTTKEIDIGKIGVEDWLR
jgi:small GTP-binding protein